MSLGPSDHELSGMTVNERLSACDLFQRWDAAAISRNKEEMVALLGEVAITREEASRIVDTILADPNKYGFWAHKKKPNNAIHRMATRVTLRAWVRSSPGTDRATGSHR